MQPYLPKLPLKHSVTLSRDITNFPGDQIYTDNIHLCTKLGTEANMTSPIRSAAISYAFNAQEMDMLTSTETHTIPSGRTRQFIGNFSTIGIYPLKSAMNGTPYPTLPDIDTLPTNIVLSGQTIASLQFSGTIPRITDTTNTTLVTTGLDLTLSISNALDQTGLCLDLPEGSGVRLNDIFGYIEMRKVSRAGALAMPSVVVSRSPDGSSNSLLSQSAKQDLFKRTLDLVVKGGDNDDSN